MTQRARSQAGFTLIEVLLAMTLMLIVFAATLTVFAVMERTSSRNQKLNDAQAQARVITDTLAKRLRNLASPSSGTTAADQQPLERAQPQDLVFRSVRSTGTPTAGNPQNLMRYRYCLGTADANRRTLFEQQQTWTGTLPAVPSDTACPGSGWTSTRTAARNVVNGARAVFAYQGSPVPGTYSELNSVAPADFPTAIALRTTLYLDPDTANPPGEANLTTRVFLRNQNRPPVPDFTWSAQGRKITLNGSASEDPEGNALKYQWFDNGVALNADPAFSAIHTFSAAAGTHVISLRVTDVGNLSADSATKTISCTSSACA